MSLKGVTLARMIDVSVSTDGVSYVTLSGVKNWEPKIKSDTDDISTHDTDGVTVMMPTSAEFTVDFELVQAFNTGATPYTRDAGQLILLTAGQEFGNAALLYFKVAHKDVTHYDGELTFPAYVTFDSNGGGEGAMKISGTLQLAERPTGTGAWDKTFGAQ